MLEILQYVLGGFWRFIGFSIILYMTLFFITNGIVQIIKAIFKKNSKTLKL